MKSILGFVAAMALTVSAFADSNDQIRLQIARSTEVKSISEAYKKQGYKCQNTEIESVDVEAELVTARKICISKDETGESAKIMLIKANTNGGILSIEFMFAG